MPWGLTPPLAGPVPKGRPGGARALGQCVMDLSDVPLMALLKVVGLVGRGVHDPQNDAHSNSAPAGVFGIQGSQKLGQSSPRQNRTAGPYA